MDDKAKALVKALAEIVDDHDAIVDFVDFVDNVISYDSERSIDVDELRPKLEAALRRQGWVFVQLNS